MAASAHHANFLMSLASRSDTLTQATGFVGLALILLNSWLEYSHYNAIEKR